MSAEHRDQRSKSGDRGLFSVPQAAAPLARVDSAGAPEAVPDERRILVFMGAAHRVGRWVVPRLFRVRAFFGEVKVDLRENRIPDDFTLDVRAFGASVTLIVPPDVDVIFDVFAFMGNALNQAHESLGGATRRQMRVVGSAYLGEVRVLVRERSPGA